MPPRVPLLPLLRPISFSTPSPCLFHRLASTVAQKKRKHQDPYALAQTRARRAANLSRQSTLQAERSKALGDPVRGVTTPFLESFDTARPLASSPPSTSSTHPSTIDGDSVSPPDPSAVTSDHLNHFVSATALRSAVDYSTYRIAPVSNGPRDDPQKVEAAAQKHEASSKNADAAMARILGVENSSSKDRLRVNVQRCIDEFGRHNTDKVLRSRPNMPVRDHDEAQLERAGPDTGSSEVQAAILTAKIRTLANFLETHGRKDKVNKRNLRLLVHRRQKLLRYLRRKERGGERWQHLIQTLGLTEGTWQGEISL